MTYGPDHDQPDQYPRPGHARQYGQQDDPWQQQGYGQQQYDPWQQPQYPPSQYPPPDQWQQQQPRQDYGQFQPPRGHRRQRSRTPLYAGIAAVLVIAGGGTAYALAGHGTTHSPGAGTHASAAKPATLAQLKKIVLQSADVPTGWKGTPHKPDPSDTATNTAMMRCTGGHDTTADQVATANSDDFTHGEATISSDATSFRSQSDMASDIAMLHSPKLSPCFDQVMKKQLKASLPAGAKIETASIKITPGSAGGPANVLATGTGTIKVGVSAQQVSVYLTVAFITGPLIEADVDTVNVGSPVPASVVKPLVAAVATRAKKG